MVLVRPPEWCCTISRLRSRFMRRTILYRGAAEWDLLSSSVEEIQNPNIFNKKHMTAFACLGVLSGRCCESFMAFKTQLKRV